MNADEAENGAESIESGAENKKNGAENGAEEMTVREKEIIDLIKEDNQISRTSIAQKLDIGTTTVYRYIDSLKTKGIIERIGGDKGGYWKIN